MSCSLFQEEKINQKNDTLPPFGDIFYTHLSRKRQRYGHMSCFCLLCIPLSFVFSLLTSSSHLVLSLSKLFSVVYFIISLPSLLVSRCSIKGQSRPPSRQQCPDCLSTRVPSLLCCHMCGVCFQPLGLCAS